MADLLRLGDQTLEIPCSNCGHKIPETIERLKQDPALQCPGCGVTINIDAEGLRRGIEEADQAIKELERAIANLGK